MLWAFIIWLRGQILTSCTILLQISPFLGFCSLWCTALCIVSIFIVFWFIRKSPSLFNFQKRLEYLTKWTTLVFLPSMIFLQQSLVSRSFIYFWGIPFLIFVSFLMTILMLSSISIALSQQQFNKRSVICLHIVKCQIVISQAIEFSILFVCTLLKCQSTQYKCQPVLLDP